MRRVIGWIAGLAGIAALVKLLRRRPRQAVTSPTAPPAQDPAEELRRKLAEARASAGVAEEPAPTPAVDVASAASGDDESGPAGEGMTGGDEPEGASLDERRADVHARAQAAIESMRAEVE